MAPEQPRAGILVTGTEVLSGNVVDRNGPWVSERLAELGVEVAHILTVADRPGRHRPGRHHRRAWAHRR